MSKAAPLYNHHYFKTLMQEMEITDTYMIIDGAGTLWHVDDITSILEDYQSKEITNELR